ncbi:glutathione S- transferase, nitrogen catabolite repression regulator [Maudiozyma exigua]|uniref:Protein URE2 n=1 Tax=Maudiozyma exigua TaxID=34358 RepID=A0A9P7BBY5_MAUEX|nr:glutathione S- transferase, nitrogen catabolite repression regulator [Kazachstania exigua]
MSNSINPPVSNLSSALRNINLQDNNNNNNINFQQNSNNINNSGTSSNINILRQNAPGQVGNEMLLQRQTNGDQGFNEPLVQHDILPSQTNTQMNSNSNIDNSRLVNFFQNQPVSGYTLFSHKSAPNGFKVAIVLSELNLPYHTFFLDFNAGEHRSPEFISITPNARVPAIIDHGMDNLSIWESAEQAQINGWLFFQATGHAPMIGQALHFRYFHSEKLPSALERYTAEVRRVYAVIEMALAEKRESLIMELDIDNAASYSAGTTPLSQSRFFDYPIWLVCDRITIADLSFVPWNNVVDRIGINIKLEYPEVYKWTKHMMRRPAVIKALRCE